MSEQIEMKIFEKVVDKYNVEYMFYQLPPPCGKYMIRIFDIDSSNVVGFSATHKTYEDSLLKWNELKSKLHLK